MSFKYILSCESPADLTEEHYKKHDMHYIPFYFSLDGKEYKDEVGHTMNAKKFYKTMADGAMTKTSPASMEDYIQYFSGFLAQGYDILHVCLSSGITGALNSINVAKEAALEKYPERKILVVDSLCASGGYGLFMDKLADLRHAGMNLEDLYNWAMEHRLEVHHWFFTTDLTYFVRGGRISAAAGWFGTALNLCPLMNVDNTGHLIPRKKCRGKKAVLRETLKRMEENAIGGLEYNGRCYVYHAAAPEDAKELAAMVEANFKHLDGKVAIENIGPIIGSHTGPGTVELLFFGNKRVD